MLPLTTLIKGGCYLVLPLLAFFIPSSWLEKGPPLCISRTLFNVQCPGCGMLRALSHAIHGDFKDAVRYNPLVLIVLPLLLYVWLRGLINEVRNIQRETIKRLVSA